MPTPGATRAGKNISDRFRKALPGLPESNAETLAEIIDRETGARELLEVCKFAAGFVARHKRLDDGMNLHEQLLAVISKAETQQ